MVIEHTAAKLSLGLLLAYTTIPSLTDSLLDMSVRVTSKVAELLLLCWFSENPFLAFGKWGTLSMLHIPFGNGTSSNRVFKIPNTHDEALTRP